MNREKKIIVPIAFLLFAACATQNEQTTGPVTVPTTSTNVVPAGTQFAITVDREIATKQPTTTTYPAHFTQAIVNQNGTEIIPAESPAQLSVVEVEEGGAVGTPKLTLAINSVNVRGREYRVASEAEAEGREGLGINERTGIFVGGGAALGTALGAIVGGVRGAIIGGVLGGAAGAAAQVITRGDEVKVPAGTELQFQLDQDWRLIPQQPEQQQEERPEDRPIS